MRSLIAVGIAFTLCYSLAREPLMLLVIAPHTAVVESLRKESVAHARHEEPAVAHEGEAPPPACTCDRCIAPVLPVSSLQVLTPQARIIAYLKVCALAAFLVALPLVSFFVWNFVGAGLYPRERRWVYVIAPFSTVLFLAGAVFCYLVLLPYGLRFLLTYGNAPIVSNIDLTKYLSFFLWMEVLMGCVFQIPLISMFLQATGIMSVERLRYYRRHAIIVMCVIGAILTPPDGVTLIIVVVPMVALYELGILAGRLPLFARKT